MKKIVLPLFFLAAGKSFSQPAPSDTNYVTRTTAIEWMPDGKAILLTLVKFHKTNRQAPFFSKVFEYDLSTKKVEELFDNGGNLAPSPDGKTIAFMKRDEPKHTDIYFYNTGSKQQTVLQTDTLQKNALGWSPDGKNLVYNVSSGVMGPNSIIDICVLNLATKQVRQVTQSDPYKSYNPVWCPDSRHIVYYLEKGDSHDQVWLTDAEGSFHTNLTHDSSTHNYYPSWLDEKTILYTQSPDNIMTMNSDGGSKQKVEGVKSFLVKFSPAAGLLAYLAPRPENKILVFDWKTKTVRVLLDESVLTSIWK